MSHLAHASSEWQHKCEPLYILFLFIHFSLSLYILFLFYTFCLYRCEQAEEGRQLAQRRADDAHLLLTDAQHTVSTVIHFVSFIYTFCFFSLYICFFSLYFSFSFLYILFIQVRTQRRANIFYIHFVSFLYTFCLYRCARTTPCCTAKTRKSTTWRRKLPPCAPA